MALFKRLISALITFSVSVALATATFAQTDYRTTFNDEQIQLETFEQSTQERRLYKDNVFLQYKILFLSPLSSLSLL